MKPAKVCFLVSCNLVALRGGFRAAHPKGLRVLGDHCYSPEAEHSYKKRGPRALNRRHPCLSLA